MTGRSRPRLDAMTAARRCVYDAREMRLYGVALVAALVPLGCGSSPTSILLHVTGPALASLRSLTIASASGTPGPRTVPLSPTAALPMKLEIVARDVVESLTFTVDATAADGSALHGVAAATTSPHHQTPVELALSGPAASGDLGAATSVCAGSGPATACASLGALFCDGFETSSAAHFPLWLDEAPVLANYNGGAANAATKVTTAAMPACRGAESMHAHVVGSAQQAYLQSNPLPNRPSPLYVRAFVYLPSVSTLVPFYFVTYNSSTSDPFLQLGVDPGGGGFAVKSSYGGDFGTIGGTVPLDRWACVEVKVDFAAVGGAIAVSVDGAPVGQLTGIDTQPAATTFDLVSLGVVAGDVPAGGAFDVYFDEVVFSSQPIGCT
jgi:hypothetical protein